MSRTDPEERRAMCAIAAEFRLQESRTSTLVAKLNLSLTEYERWTNKDAEDFRSIKADNKLNKTVPSLFALSMRAFESALFAPIRETNDPRRLPSAIQHNGHPVTVLGKRPRKLLTKN